ncbi:hypothetical protein [Palleronia caenipelagi]|uniref:Uncharacterized protein n=1 Tax=Palleronia caenipelagi TaxID=2489174 RepID=A0A547PW77_9RHOB|nr:hypothetical protein [Palleronia caenipelagi]TRD18366.1 hypothetical protein FEV53_11970 [Palleronia caenipelagi]
MMPSTGFFADFRTSGTRQLLRDPVTGRYLHMSGRGTTPRRVWAWSGTADQAAAMKRVALNARGEPWPYVLIREPLSGDTELSGWPAESEVTDGR